MEVGTDDENRGTIQTWFSAILVNHNTSILTEQRQAHGDPLRLQNDANTTAFELQLQVWQTKTMKVTTLALGSL